MMELWTEKFFFLPLLFISEIKIFQNQEYNITLWVESKLFNVESFTFENLSDMDSHSVRAYTNIYRSAISE